MNKLTVTVGIPAYNEEANIGNLISAVQAQEETFFNINKIIIVADAGRDSTAQIVKSFKDKRIIFIENKIRLGQISAQNKIFSMSDTDVVVLFEADTLPLTNHFIHKLLKPLLKDKNLGLIQGNKKAILPETFFEKVISNQARLYRQLTLKNPNTINSFCTGRSGRAFASKVYEKLRWPPAVPEDSYALLWCRNKDIKTMVQLTAFCKYRCHQSFLDYLKDRQKNFSAKKALLGYFSGPMVNAVYQRPLGIVIKVTVLLILINPAYCIYYLITKIIISQKLKSWKYTDFWSVSDTTKFLDKNIYKL